MISMPYETAKRLLIEVHGLPEDIAETAAMYFNDMPAQRVDGEDSLLDLLVESTTIYRSLGKEAMLDTLKRLRDSSL